MTKKDRKRLSDDSPVALVCLTIHFVANFMEGEGLKRQATAQLTKVRRWNGEVLRGFGITDQKTSRHTADILHVAYNDLAKKLSPKLKALPKTLNLGATAICVDALLAHALTGRRELRRTPAMRYLVQTWETLTLMLSTGEDDAAEAGTQIYMEVV